jgi:hypothetical protein
MPPLRCSKKVRCAGVRAFSAFARGRFFLAIVEVFLRLKLSQGKVVVGRSELFTNRRREMETKVRGMSGFTHGRASLPYEEATQAVPEVSSFFIIYLCTKPAWLTPGRSGPIRVLFRSGAAQTTIGRGLLELGAFFFLPCCPQKTGLARRETRDRAPLPSWCLDVSAH